MDLVLSLSSLFITLAHALSASHLRGLHGSRTAAQYAPRLASFDSRIIFRTAMFGTSCRLLPTSTPVFGSVYGGVRHHSMMRALCATEANSDIVAEKIQNSVARTRERMGAHRS